MRPMVVLVMHVHKLIVFPVVGIEFGQRMFSAPWHYACIRDDPCVQCRHEAKHVVTIAD